MIDTQSTFYDKKCTIFTREQTEEDNTIIWGDPTALYEEIACDYFIAPRGNVTNWLGARSVREEDIDRMDLIIPGIVYDPTKPLKQGMFVKLLDFYGNPEAGEYVIDQFNFQPMPNGDLDSIYVRINLSQTLDSTDVSP